MFLAIEQKTGGLVFLNLDPLLGQTQSKLDIERNVNPVQYIDKFYGFGQNHISKTKIYSLKPEFLPVLEDFRRTYYFDKL